jgi:putative hydrolase of the HAD superfamily
MTRLITTILFDLDHTLYEPATGLLHAGDRMITSYLARRLELPHEEADALRARLWRQYGTSARGAEIEFGLGQPEFYYESLKDLDPAAHLERDEPLAAMLEALPAELHVVTNSAADYAHRVLRALGIDHCFGEVFGIEALQWCPKPEASAYDCVLQRLGRDPAEIAMVEDFPWNLVPAKQLGMFTVFLGPEPEEADIWLQRLLDLPQKLAEAGVELSFPLSS